MIPARSGVDQGDLFRRGARCQAHTLEQLGRAVGRPEEARVGSASGCRFQQSPPAAEADGQDQIGIGVVTFGLVPHDPRHAFQFDSCRIREHVVRSLCFDPHCFDAAPADSFRQNETRVSNVREIAVRLLRGVSFQLAGDQGIASWKLTPLVFSNGAKCVARMAEPEHG
jgi:hypothetical protein